MAFVLTILRSACMVLIALRAYRLSEAMIGIDLLIIESHFVVVTSRKSHCIDNGIMPEA